MFGSIFEISLKCDNYGLELYKILHIFYQDLGDIHHTLQKEIELPQLIS